MRHSKLYYERTKGLAPFAYTIVDKWLYFCDQCIPGLFRYHFEKKKAELVTVFDSKYVKQNFYKIVCFRDELWLLPFLDGKIISFNMVTNNVFYHEVPSEVNEKVIPFSDMMFREEKAYLIPHGKNRFLIEMDLLTHEMKTLRLFGSEKESVFFSGAIHVSNQIYLAESVDNKLILFDLDKKKKEDICAINVQLNNFLMRKLDDQICFFPITVSGCDKLLIYDTDNNCLMEKEYPIKSLHPGDVCITVVLKNSIWVLANKQKKIYQINQMLEIESEIDILNFNDRLEEVYVSGTAFIDCLFWNGHRGIPLIQVKDDMIQMLDVGKNSSLFEVYMEIVNKYDSNKGEIKKLSLGKAIYDAVGN